MVSVKQSKKVDKVVKGDKVKIDGKEYEVDAHYVMIDHGKNKEMAMEVFDPKAKKEGEGEGQLRYFDDNVEGTLGFYVLKEIVYEAQDISKIEW
jgi:hypothetical protein